MLVLEAEHPVRLQRVLHVAGHLPVPGLAHRVEQGLAGAAAAGQLAAGEGGGDGRLGQQRVAGGAGHGLGVEAARGDQARSSRMAEADRLRPRRGTPKRCSSAALTAASSWVPDTRPAARPCDWLVSGAGMKPWSAVSTAR